MGIVALTSAAGAPGVSTTALGLTLSWPGSAMLADFDHQQAFLAGYLQGAVATEKGLLRVLDAARHGHLQSDAVRDQAVALPEDDQPEGHRRLLLPGLPTPAAAGFLPAAVPAILEAFRALGDAGLDVVCDLGRAPREGFPPAVLPHLGRLLLLTVPTLRGLAAARACAERLQATARSTGSTTRIGVVVVRRAKSLGIKGEAEKAEQQVGETYYSDREVAGWLGFPVDGTILHDARWASLLSEGGPRPTKWSQSGYAASLTRLARAEYQHLHLVGAGRTT